MAAFSLSSCYIELNSVDYSAFVKSVTLSSEAAELNTTDFASSGWTEMIAGIKSGSLGLTFNQDVASGQIDSAIWALFATVVTFKIRATSAAKGASNPEYSGSVLINAWPFLDGSVGDLAEVTVTWPLSGAVARGV